MAARQIYTFGGWRVSLNPRHAEALKLRGQGVTLKKIGDALGNVSRERARQIIDAATRKVRLQLIDGGAKEADIEGFLACPIAWGWAGPEE